MKPLFVIAASLAFSVAVTAKSKPVPPFAQLIDSPIQAKVLAAESSHESKYLGFNWVNAYCFGALGCAVSNNPAVSQFTFREAFVEVGPWIFDILCEDHTWDRTHQTGTLADLSLLAYLPNCGEIVGDSAKIKLRKNGPGMDVLSTKTRDTVYRITSAINIKTGEIWGDATVDAWRTVRAEIAIADALRKMKLDAQIVWYQKLRAMHAYGLATPENLETILAEMTHPS